MTACVYVNFTLTVHHYYFTIKCIFADVFPNISLIFQDTEKEQHSARDTDVPQPHNTSFNWPKYAKVGCVSIGIAVGIYGLYRLVTFRECHKFD